MSKRLSKRECEEIFVKELLAAGFLWYAVTYERGNYYWYLSAIRWTDKVFVKSNGDIIDFNGRVVGHINLEIMKGGAE